MIYNAKNTVCMCIKYKPKQNLRIPDVFLNDNKLNWLSEHKYLGVKISKDFSDELILNDK